MVMKGMEDEILYFLQGSNVVGMVVTVSKSSENSLASLWHKRFSHVSERGLQELDKQGLFGSEKLGELDFCENCVYGRLLRLSLAICLMLLRKSLPMYILTCGGLHKRNH